MTTAATLHPVYKRRRCRMSRRHSLHRRPRNRMLTFLKLLHPVIMTLSTQGCPLHQMIKQWVLEAVERIEDVGAIEVEVVWEPAWNISMADDNVKEALAGM